MEDKWVKGARYRISESLGDKQVEEDQEWGDKLSSRALKIIKSIGADQEGTREIWYWSLSCSFQILPNPIRIKDKKHSNPKPSERKPRSIKQM